MRQYFIIGAAFFILIVGVFSIWFWGIHQNNQETVWDTDTFLANIINTDQKNVFEQIRNQLPLILKKGGVSAALDVADRAIKGKHIAMDQCHVLVHMIGHEAYFYHFEDIPNMVYENSSSFCGAGMQHGTEAQIVLSSPDFVSDLREYCKELWNVYGSSECHHGAGHAFMEETLDIQEAVEFCDRVTDDTEIPPFSCWQGAFSQYVNFAAGYDGDTGLRIPGDPVVVLDHRDPLSLCLSLPEKYQYACATQVNRIFLGGLDQSLSYCAQDHYEDDIQYGCVLVIAAGFGQDAIFRQDTFQPPPDVVFDLPKNLQKAFLEGVLGEFRSFTNTGIAKDWSMFCNSFPNQEDQDICDKKFSGNYNDYVQ